MWAAAFPGQGSQHPEMGKFLFDEFKLARETFEEASDAIAVDFKKLCFTGTDEELALTKNTQPALLLVSTATDRVIRSLCDFKVTAMAGHSVGEYAALVSSGAVNFSDAIRAVRKRGEAMQQAVPVGTGAMAAVMGMTSEQVVFMCKWVEQESGFKPLEPANFNSPGQIVISGNAKAIEWLQANFNKDTFATASAAAVKDADGNPVPVGRVKFITLKVSAPFHCSMMKPAEDVMRAFLNDIEFKTAKTPVVQNFSALPVTEGSTLRENVIRQISAPVRWIECVEKLDELGCTRMAELGSGKVLSGLAKKILGPEKMPAFNVTSIEELKIVTGT